ncbi:MAG: RsmB/NOP family class I SAM-dependent RNA methyltransferase [Candidatus Nanohaloarchaea archaeon]|nr:RsmB/NOP family class I SAM-dependent RNA methyltransferase [Candidatus Nanohaloarchaea archaeon]
MERYRSIIPEFEAFQQAVSEPQPRDVRVNTITSSVAEVVELLEEEDLTFERLDWNDRFLRFPHDARPGKTFPHWLGYYYVQESVSGVPPLALDPQPGESVLDLCAAPGSKTTQVAALMDNRGEILANDVRQGRIRGLLANIYQQGVVNAQVVQHDGRQLPEDRRFDRVLVDVPCSAEGNVRTEDGLEDGADEDTRNGVVPLQEQLLDKALRLCRDDGVVVYSTCTFAPEENEAIVDGVLDRASVEPLAFDFPHADGVTSWQGQEFAPELANCVRVYPHHLDSGGIFVAKLRKTG